MSNSPETIDNHTNDEALRDFDFGYDRPAAVQGLSETALNEALFNSHGEDREGASILPAIN